jgi:hypothetical protein
MNDSGDAVRGRNKIIAIVAVLTISVFVQSLPLLWMSGLLPLLVKPAIALCHGALLLRGWRWAWALMVLMLAITAVRWTLAMITAIEVGASGTFRIGAVALLAGTIAVILFASADIRQFFASKRES